jgi:alanine-synthesizing transaminase
VDTSKRPDFSDQKFALDLLERKHVLVAPGTSFNVPYRDHFRITLLPDEETMAQVFGRMEELLDDYAAEAHTSRAANP